MRFIVAFFFVFLLGISCSTFGYKKTFIENKPAQISFEPIPGWKAIQSKNKFYKAEDVSLLFYLFLDEWQSRGFGSFQEIDFLFDQIELIWVEKPFVSRKIPDSVLWGLTSVRHDKILVYVYDQRKRGPKLGNTSLVHELIHVSLYGTTGNLRADHFGNDNQFTDDLEDLKNFVNSNFW